MKTNSEWENLLKQDQGERYDLSTADSQDIKRWYLTYPLISQSKMTDKLYPLYNDTICSQTFWR